MAGRILIGALPSGAYGVRISEAGYSVSTQPPDNERLIFSSEWDEVLPIHQAMSFTHRTTAQQGTLVTQTISYPSLGYIPFVDFFVRGNGDAVPAGSDLYYSTRTYERASAKNLRYWNPQTSGDANGYIRCNITIDTVYVESFVRNISGSSQGFPRTWSVYCLIYRARAY